MGIMRTSDKARSLTLILCIVGFFGIGGLQRFYVGKVGTGLLFLFTGGLFGIGTIYDLIKIGSNTFTDNVGLPVVED